MSSLGWGSRSLIRPRDEKREYQVCFTSSVGISQQLWMDSLGFKINQRPAHAAHQLARTRDHSGDFSVLLLERLQGSQVNLASHQMSVLFGFNLSGKTQTGSFSVPVQMSKAVTFCSYWPRGSSCVGGCKGSRLTMSDWLLYDHPPKGGLVVSRSLIVCAALTGRTHSRSTRGL